MSTEQIDKKSNDDMDDSELFSHDMDDVHFEEHSKKVEEGEGPWLISYADMMTLLMGFFALIASFSKPDIKSFEEVKKSAVEKFGGEYSEPYAELEKNINQAIKAAGADGKVKVTRGADGVTLKFEGASLFESGSFTVNADGAVVINSIVKGLTGNLNTYKVTIEGHTDNVPITHPIIASNWELSAIRAARVAQLIEQHGFKKEQLTIQGWGETKPELPNMGKNGETLVENQAKNRRVIIKISTEDRR